MFGAFNQSDIEIVSQHGKLTKTKGMIHSGEVIIPNAQIEILTGDEIRRKLPNGVEEAFEVIDPVFFDNHHGIPAHYQVKVKRKGIFPHGTGGNYSITVSGQNSRVNINSQDHSQNIVADKIVFSQMREALDRSLHDAADREKLKALISKMEQTAGNRSEFMQAYQAFIATAANHMTILAPFIPALSHFLT